MNSEKVAERYSTEATDWQGEPAFRLHDHLGGAQALIVPGLGSNCVAWSILSAQGQPIEILETPPTPQDLGTRRFKAGIPVLWPFPGRVREARYRFEGLEYFLPRTDKGGVHHIHGLVISSPWRVVEQSADAEGAKLVTTVGPADLTEEQRRGYPFDFALSLTFTLAENRLIIETMVENKSTSQNMPFGYGLHPYFKAPLVSSSTTPDRTACLVHIPAAARWPTQDGLPTGPVQPLAPTEDFQQWRPLGAEPFDHMYGAVSPGGSVAGFRDPGASLEVQVQADQHYREWVLFTQPNRPSLCVEPYTCPPNAINFAEEGLSDSGLSVLAPASRWASRLVFQVLTYAPQNQ